MEIDIANSNLTSAELENVTLHIRKANVVIGECCDKGVAERM